MVGVEGRTYVKRCHTCRKRKIKCDGQSPACQKCIDHGLLCTGYSRKLDFILFNAQSKSKVNDQSTVEDQAAPKGQAPGRGGFSVASLRNRPTMSQKHPIHPLFSNQALSAPQYRLGFLGILQDRYIPDLPSVSSGQGESICSSWIAAACDLSSTSTHPDMLIDSLLAMSLALVGKEREQNELSMAGVKHYSRALSQLRAGLRIGPLAVDQADDNLVTCLCCAMYEILANRSRSASLHHLQGLGALLEGLGVENVQSSTSRRTYYELRAIALPICLMTRHASFLCRPEWIKPTWESSEVHSSTHLQTLADHALRIPGLMERFDTLQQSIQRRGNIASSRQILHQLLQEAMNVQKDLGEWQANIQADDNTSRLYILRLANSSSLDDTNLAQTFPISYTFPNFDLAAALIYHEMTQIFLNLLFVDMEACIRQLNMNFVVGFPQIDIRALITSAVTSADKICQSIEYFFEDNKRMIGRLVILTPFEAARNLYTRFWLSGTGDVKLDASVKDRVKFCFIVSERIRASGLPLWDS